MIIVLDTLKKHIELKDIVWPVFRLGEREPMQMQGLVFYHKEYLDPENVIYNTNYRIVDDRNIAQSSLGLRRLQIKENLFPIGTAVYFLQDVIKLAKSTTWFIDSQGKVFQHKKIRRAKLTTHRIKQVLPAQGIGCVLELVGLPERFKSLQVPKEFEVYAGVLSYKGKNLLYGYYDEPIKNTWRKV